MTSLKQDTPRSKHGLARAIEAARISIRRGIGKRLRDPRLYVRLQFGSALGILVGLALAASIFAGVFGTIPAQLSDFLYKPYPASGQVVIVAIDDKSVQAIGALPWQRQTIASLINTLAQAHPRVIALDVVLADPANGDAAVAQAMQNVPRMIQPLIGVQATRLTSPSNGFPDFDVGLKPPASLLTVNTQLGHDMIMPDPDGVVRRIPVAIQVDDRLYPALGIAALAMGPGNPTYQFDNNSVSFDTTRLPIDHQGQLQLNYFDFDSRSMISALDVLSAQFDLGSLRNKIILIGATGSVTAQKFKTPLAGNRFYSSTEIQANLAETILSQRSLVEQDRLTQIVMILLLTVMAGATLVHFGILTAIGLDIIYIMAYLGYAFAKFDAGILVQPWYPILGLLCTLSGTAIFRYFSEEQQRAFIATLLRRYVAPKEVEQLTNNIDYGLMPMGGIRREVSALALDVSDLEDLAQSMTAQALIELLDQYVSIVVKAIFENNGSIVKHTGSAILAAWNLWTDQTDHAQIAVRTAVEIKHQLAEFNRRQPKELTIQSGIGIATGSVVAGRIGARPRAEYAIIGQVVGMAERIALKPERGVFIDVTTRERIGDEFGLVEVKPVRMRRKTDPSQVWQLVEPSEPQDNIINEPEKEIAVAK